MTAPKPIQVILCRRCHTRFERGRRGAMPKYCQECRPAVHREQKRDAMAAARADLEAKRAMVREILEPLRDHLTSDMWMTAEEFLDNLAPDADVVAFVQDKMPAGTATPSGPDEGCTSEFEDLRGDLEQRRIAAIMHDWHAEHPGWWSD